MINVFSNEITAKLWRIDKISSELTLTKLWTHKKDKKWSNIAGTQPSTVSPSIECSGTSSSTNKAHRPKELCHMSMAMKLALRWNSKPRFVDESCVKCMYRGELAKQWEKYNVIVIFWIGSTVASELIISIIFASSAKKVWNDFKEWFDRCSLTRIYHLWTIIASLR